MRIVLDTNVLISGVLFSGPPSQILSAWADGRLDFLATLDILSEYRRVATRLSKKYPSVDVESVVDLVIRESRIVEPAPVAANACDDQPTLPSRVAHRGRRP